MPAAPLANDVSPFGTHAPRGIVSPLLGLIRGAPPTWLGRRRAFALRTLAVRLLGGRPLDVEALGARMRLYPYNNVSEKRILFMPNAFDPEELAFLGRRIAATPSGAFAFIDVGANIGGYALSVASRAGARARILAIEPQRDLFERLAFNIGQNPFATIKALDCAVADREGEVTLFLDARNRGETSMRVVHSDAEGQRVRVLAKPLLAILRAEGFEEVDAIKIDIEGAEDLVLEPFFREAPERLWPKALVLEVPSGAWALDLEGLLRRCGYDEVLRTRRNLAYVRGEAGRAHA